MQRKYQIGDKVVYDGLVGIVESISESASSNLPMVSLVSEVDSEISCTAMESECQPYDGRVIDQQEALNEAYNAGFHIRNMGGRLTDKYFRDGNH
jgi:hypothetical protein